MAGTYPLSPVFEAVNFKINTPTVMTETVSGKVRRVGMGHSFYTFSVQYPTLSRYQAGPVMGFVAQQYGPLESFQIVLPELSYSKVGNQTTTTVTVTGGTDALAGGGTGYAAGKDDVAVAGVAAGKNLLRAGDFFKFANHSKVYMCAVSWTAGQNLFFSGSLVKDVPNGTQLTITAVPFTVILDGEVQELDVGVGGLSKINLDMRETW